MSDAAVLPLKAWSRWNAVVMLSGTLAAVAVGRPWPLSALALPSLGVLVFLCRRGFTPQGSFGPANAVTAFRFALIVALGFVLHGANGWLYFGVVQLIFALDGVDGWVARRTRSESAFGAHFDMESDAVLVLMLGVELWQRGRLGAWVVVPGLLRYLYVLCLSAFPPVPGDPPRRTFARRAFVALMLGVPLALIEPGLVGTASAAAGAALVSASFALSFRWAYRA